MNRFRLMILFLCLSLCLSMTACQWRISGQSGTAETVSELSLEEIPDFSGRRTSCWKTTVQIFLRKS